ncbi:chloride channel protein [Phyllobacterium chamaecytisi]|uniref:chloride channel protein n=1 Tax=Phyllobacterium chamaecytisi TaxID=2876082 RepID=UPI001CCEB750|nr:chloride channel protein [Phyllobacterium sp. KW56]MBZ9601407.1 chloride channel protein [Phyllobacterium sp. KW56]
MADTEPRTMEISVGNDVQGIRARLLRWLVLRSEAATLAIIYSVATGVLSGLAGMALALVLHWVQHRAFGYSLAIVTGPESFLEGVSSASKTRRIAVLTVCGLIAGLGWYLLRRFGRPLTSVSSAVKESTNLMPVAETMIHGLLQMVTVAMGSPLGREVAPRELGALLGQHVARWGKVSDEDFRLLVACGAGAGLAAVYNVPTAAMVFILEVLVKRVSLKILLYAGTSCTTAAWVARAALGADPQYSIPAYGVDEPLVLWSLAFGPLLGAAGYAFSRWTEKCTRAAPLKISQVWKSALAFLIVGIISTVLPQLLGNGKGPAELAFSDNLSPGLALLLIVAKLLSLTLVLRAGARGGLLTPGFSLGALIAIAIGGLMQPWMTFATDGTLAIVGAASFLSSSMAMPFTAIFLSMEFLDAPLPFLLPITIAVVSASAVRLALKSALERRAAATPMAFTPSR